MTRITNFGRKRTYLEAGFSAEPAEDVSGPDPTAAEVTDVTGTEPKNQQAEGDSEPAKKKRKRHRPKKKKPDADTANPEPSAEATGSTSTLGKEGQVHGEHGQIEEKEGVAGPSVPAKQGKKKKKAKDKKKYISPGEQRRLKRIEEKLAATTCFACRQKGHSAKTCPKTTAQAPEGNDVLAEDNAKGKSKAAPVVGLCYRCGSNKHNLSRCKKPANPDNPLPYASCFVCSGIGHLASSCPQNKDRGVYPNGGCCKICGDTTHLAKDCSVRRNDVLVKAAVGTGKGAGADEDDFMTLQRRTKEVEREEKNEERMKRLWDTGERDGTRPSFPSSRGTASGPVKRKVVVF